MKPAFAGFVLYIWDPVLIVNLLVINEFFEGSVLSSVSPSGDLITP